LTEIVRVCKVPGRGRVLSIKVFLELIQFFRFLNRRRSLEGW
jgi:hypothetical protein